MSELETVEFNICPVAKPRMTRRDKWLNPPRPAVAKYRTFADELRLKANLAGFNLGDAFKVVFYLPVPKSASNRKKRLMNNQPHTKKPDIDNLIKSLSDIFCPDSDSHIWKITASKRWIDGAGKIIIQNFN